MTKEHTTADLIAQARKWERGYGEGYWFNAMADEIERLDADAAGAQAELASVKACWAEALGNVATRNREIEQLRRERHQLRNELTAARLENQQRRALLVEVYNHGENSELHGRIGAALGAAPGEDASPVEPSEVPLPERDPGRVALAIGLLERFRDGRIDSLKSRHESILGCRKQLEEERDIFGYAIEALRTLPAKYGEQA